MRYPVFAAVVAMLLPGIGTLAAPPAPAVLPLHDCRIEGPRGAGSVAARCGELRVAENPDDPAGRQIALAVAVVPVELTPARRSLVLPPVIASLAVVPQSVTPADFKVSLINLDPKYPSTAKNSSKNRVNRNCIN
jgi:hypothetical protein